MAGNGVRRVLFISPHFPPDSSAGTHRARLLAPRLPEHGWEPTVLTVDRGSYEGPLDEALAESVPDHLRVVRVSAWPATLTRRAGIGDLGLRAFQPLRRAASALLSREHFDAIVHHDLPGVSGAARPDADAAISRAVRARLSGSVGRRVGPIGRRWSRRRGRREEPREPLAGDAAASRSRFARLAA